MLRRGFVALVVSLIATSQSFAVILYRSPTRNTSAPSGAFANSGWQFQGSFGNFLGTPVAPQWFLTAAHIGGTNQFTLNGTTYNIDSSFIGSGPGWINDPNTDLRLWKIQGSFPSFAQLWDESIDGTEVGKQLVVFGRGTSRGAEVYGPAGAPRDGAGTRIPARELKGWMWQPYETDNHAQSWGTNTVDSIIDESGSNLGQLLTLDFDRISPLVDESALAAGDSGGAVFIRSPVTSTWKLAGINLAVDGPWRTRKTGTAFDASIFDAGGLFIGNNPRQFIQDGAMDVPGSSYSTRVSSNLSWIRSVIGPAMDPQSIPEPSVGLIGVIVAFALHRRSTRS